MGTVRHNSFKLAAAIAVLIVTTVALMSQLHYHFESKKLQDQTPDWLTNINFRADMGDDPFLRLSDCELARQWTLLSPGLVPRIGNEDLPGSFCGPLPARFSSLGVETQPVLFHVKLLSGPDWVKRFPTSKSTDDLVPSFGPSVDRFIHAMRQAGAYVKISATYRPPERAYLMHYSYRIARGEIDPGDVPLMEGVDVAWQHVDPTGRPDLKASKKAAAAMVDAYRVAYRPALFSPHISRRAIDMTISWQGSLKIRDADGRLVVISNGPRNGDNPLLHKVGRSYGVHKFVPDPPHWEQIRVLGIR